ncbi:hypothetical protein KDAU_52210 [Dictyobacter aurantiacus]|uniref:Uncharacterized protein n=1 Tax=Dictyobacter aurantiacus TaxID=1936993 RepID=A0A401ZM34_9CHLR|nr:hypothetical protein KDAU_52210 [Dictyobacter aurantiacus]
MCAVGSPVLGGGWLVPDFPVADTIAIGPAHLPGEYTSRFIAVDDLIAEIIEV